MELKSKIIIESLGTNVIEKDKTSTLNIDGRKIIQQGLSELEGEELQVFLADVESLKQNEIIDRVTINLSPNDLQNVDKYKKFLEKNNLNISINSLEEFEQVKESLDNIRNCEFSDVVLKDNSGQITKAELAKYEGYANNLNVLFKSKILKESMGFDRLPTTKSTGDNGVLYNIKINGKVLQEQGLHKLDGAELENLLQDLKNLSQNVNIGGIELSNIEMPEGTDLSALTKTFEKVHRIKIENTQIPNLDKAIENMENTQNVETVIIKDSGVTQKDIRNVKFSEYARLVVDKQSKPRPVQPTNEIASGNINGQLPQQEKTWFQKWIDKIKGTDLYKRIFSKDAPKPLPPAQKEARQEKTEQNSFIEGLRANKEDMTPLKSNPEKQRHQKDIEER